MTIRIRDVRERPSNAPLSSEHFAGGAMLTDEHSDGLRGFINTLEGRVEDLAQYSLYAATIATGDMELWVDASTGDDDNDGTSEAPLATLVEAETRIPDIHFNVTIHTAPHTGDGYAAPTFRERIRRGNIDIIADSGGTLDDGFNELATGVAQASTSISALIAEPGLGVNTYRGKTIEMTSGAQSGARKTIADHTDTSVEPCVLWPPSSVVDAIAPGDTYRIVEPVTRIFIPTLAGSTSSARWAFTEGQPEQHSYGSSGATDLKYTINLVNFYLYTSASSVLRIQLGQAVRMFGCETNKALGFIGGVVAIGVDGTRNDFAYMQAAIGARLAGASDEAWVGWGLTCTTGFLPSSMVKCQAHGVVATRAIFYQCHSAEVSGFNFHTLGVQVFGEHIGACHVRLHGNYYGTSIRSRCTNTTGTALEIRGSDAHCYVSKTLLTSTTGAAVLATEGGVVELADNIDLASVTGVKARYGGRAMFEGTAFESVTVSGNELEAGNGPQISTIAGLASAGAYIAEADGSVVQRTS